MIRITRDDFIRAMQTGWEDVGYLAWQYSDINDEGERSVCAIGAAARSLGISGSALAMSMPGHANPHGAALFTRITDASDAAGQKHIAIQAVKNAVNDAWPTDLVLEV